MVDWTIKLGDLLVLVGFAGSCAIFAFKVGGFSRMVDAMGTEIRELKTTVQTIATAMTTMAVQKVQIERVEEDMRDMKRGVGWVQDHGARSVDREYK